MMLSEWSGDAYGAGAGDHNSDDGDLGHTAQGDQTSDRYGWWPAPSMADPWT